MLVPTATARGHHDVAIVACLPQASGCPSPRTPFPPDAGSWVLGHASSSHHTLGGCRDGADGGIGPIPWYVGRALVRHEGDSAGR